MSRSTSYTIHSLIGSSAYSVYYAEAADKSPPSVFWLFVHGLFCLASLLLGFRFSRLIFFFLFETLTVHAAINPPLNHTAASGRVVVGRHGILIRLWPHPNPVEVIAANRIIKRVQARVRVQ